MNTNPLRKTKLLQQLAHKIDTGVATELELEAFDYIMEVLNEQEKINNASTGFVGNYKIRSRRIRFV
jgi:hypothetical protein